MRRAAGGRAALSGAMAATAALGTLACTLWACQTSPGAEGRFDTSDFAYRFDAGEAGRPPQPWDAGPPADAALPTPELCAALCGPLADCAAADEPEDAAAPPLCAGVGPQDREGFATDCAAICAETPGFDVALSGVVPAPGAPADCRAALVAMRAASDDLALACVPSPPPADPRCEAFGARIAACTVEICANAADVEAGIAFWLTNSCETQVAAGLIAPEVADALPGADSPCDDPSVSGLVERLVGSATAQAVLTGLCIFGPALAADVCAAGCAQLANCLPAHHTFRNPDYCAFVCALDASLSPALRCAARAPACEPLSSCF